MIAQGGLTTISGHRSKRLIAATMPVADAGTRRNATIVTTGSITGKLNGPQIINATVAMRTEELARPRLLRLGSATRANACYVMYLRTSYHVTFLCFPFRILATQDIKYVPVYHTRTVNKYIRQPPRYIYKTRYKTITKKKYVPVPVPTPSKPTVIVKHVVDHVPFPVNVEHVAKDATAAESDVGHVVQYTPASRPSHRTQSPFPYDCEAGHFTKQGWSRSKKQWCCFHFQKGCHLLQSCEAPCILPGQAGGEGTCASTTRWASANMFAGRNDACQLAFHQVAMNCHLCHSCQIHSTGCDLQEGFKLPHHMHRIHLIHVPSMGRTSKSDASQELHGTRPHEVHEHFSHALSHAAFRCDTTDGSTWCLYSSEKPLNPLNIVFERFSRVMKLVSRALFANAMKISNDTDVHRSLLSCRSAAEALWCCSHRGMGCADSEK